MRILFTLLLMEGTLTGFNYFSSGQDYKYSWELLNPVQAIYNAIAFLNEQLRWSFFISYISILMIFIVLLLFYFYLSKNIFLYHKEKSN